MGKELNEGKTNKETLALLQMMHGGNVECTNGLFHISDANHNEVYVNPTDGSLDKRGLYNTIVVLDNIVAAKVTNNSVVNSIILDKKDLKCLYKTAGSIHYLDENIIYDKYDSNPTNHEHTCVLISHTGKNTWELHNVNRIFELQKSMYLVTSSLMFNDKILEYNVHRDSIRDLTLGKNYSIHILGDSKVSIMSMQGGRYIYNLDNKECIDEFTGEKVDRTALFA